MAFFLHNIGNEYGDNRCPGSRFLFRTIGGVVEPFSGQIILKPNKDNCTLMVFIKDTGLDL